jgi:hypothetical protein
MELATERVQMTGLKPTILILSFLMVVRDIEEAKVVLSDTEEDLGVVMTAATRLR